ncbi:hypothetical protein EGW08_005323 [Elysia chlorotica]|uniref:X-box-binding protein 1 n=1 Tax=Elysia chlorotica TaxID=188477 RepID=A0A3S1C9W9_ELYCH|nr:hypothetical protein EGW08_005323 [Elysia chlorotica]
MAQYEFEGVSFDDLWDKDDAVVSSDSVMDVMKDPFVAPQSHNIGLFYPGAELSSADVTRGSKAADMNLNALPSGLISENFDLVKLDKSPWHESDSGISMIMSEAGSPTGCDDLTVDTVASIQPVVDWSGLDEGTDDLATYLLGADISILDNDKEGALVHNFEQSQGSPTNINNISTKNICYPRALSSGAPQHLPMDSDLNIDVENSDSECSSSGGISLERHNFQNADPLNYFQEVCTKTKRKPAVKVLKVLKASPASDCCDDDIMKALDERSRKNAIQAKMNREKKKVYVNGLEKDVEKLGKENKELRDENIELKKNLGSLEEEVRYLKSVLVNASSLSSLLRNIGGVSEVKLSASIVGRKRGASEFVDHSYTADANTRSDNSRAERSAKRARMVHENLERAGVCLHVNGSEASLEFCSKCSSLAKHTQSQKS